MFNFVFRIDVYTTDSTPVLVAENLLIKVKSDTLAHAQTKITNAFPSTNTIDYKQYVLMQEIPEMEE